MLISWFQVSSISSLFDGIVAFFHRISIKKKEIENRRFVRFQCESTFFMSTEVASRDDQTPFPFVRRNIDAGNQTLSFFVGSMSRYAMSSHLEMTIDLSQRLFRPTRSSTGRRPGPNEKAKHSSLAFDFSVRNRDFGLLCIEQTVSLFYSIHFVRRSVRGRNASRHQTERSSHPPPNRVHSSCTLFARQTDVPPNLSRAKHRARSLARSLVCMWKIRNKYSDRSLVRSSPKSFRIRGEQIAGNEEKCNKKNRGTESGWLVTPASFSFRF